MVIQKVTTTAQQCGSKVSGPVLTLRPLCDLAETWLTRIQPQRTRNAKFRMLSFWVWLERAVEHQRFNRASPVAHGFARPWQVDAPLMHVAGSWCGGDLLVSERIAKQILGRGGRGGRGGREREPMTYANSLSVGDRNGVMKLAAHQPAALSDLLKGEGQAQQLTHAVDAFWGALRADAATSTVPIEMFCSDKDFWTPHLTVCIQRISKTLLRIWPTCFWF